MIEQDILPGYTSAWSCSTAKKGYAGTAVFFTKQAEAWQGDGVRETGNGSASTNTASVSLLSVRSISLPCCGTTELHPSGGKHQCGTWMYWMAIRV